MELVIDLKIDNKSSSYRNVITDFGYFKKITGESVSMKAAVPKGKDQIMYPSFFGRIERLV